MAAREPFIEIFKGADGKWYGHRKARNGRIVATAGQGYVKKQGVLHWAAKTHPDCPVRLRAA